MENKKLEGGWITITNFLIAGSIAYIFYCVGSRWFEYRKETAFGDSHSCLPPPRVQNEAPLGLDRLRQIWTANNESRLMELFWMHFQMWKGWTVDQRFLGAHSFGTCEPENLCAVLGGRGGDDWSFGPRRKLTFPLFGDGIFNQEGPAWKHSRDLLRPQFTYKQYQDLSIFSEHVENLLSAAKSTAASNNGIVDLQPLFFRFTLDTTTAFLFGESVNSLKERGGEESEFKAAFDDAQAIVAKRFRLVELYWMIGGKKFYGDCRRIHGYVDDILDRGLIHRYVDGVLDENDGKKEGIDSGEKEEERNKKYVFLDAISKLFPDRMTLRHQMMNVLLAGRDTTACLLSWTFFFLVRHPRVLEKLKAEISSVQGKKDLNRTDLRNMPYLTNVLKETLRLYPSVPTNTRSAVRTTTLPVGGGPDRRSPILVRKGEAVAYSVYSMHRRPDLYGPDAEDFRPERWDEDLPLYRDEITKNWGYLPFNGGPRICLGMDFAMTEAALAVFKMLERFPNIGLPRMERIVKTGREKQKLTLTISCGDGCNVRLE